MPYTVPLRTIPFTFMDGTRAGLQVDFRLSLSIDELIEVLDLGERIVKAKKVQVIRDLIREIASIGLVGWDLEEDGQPVPPTPENYTSKVPMRESMVLIGRYIGAAREIGGVAGPLAPPSASGDSSAKRPAKSRRPNSPAPSSSNA